jgi:antirestriction protein
MTIFDENSNPNSTTTITVDNDTPSIYVACLAAYNAGYLHGKWIDATQSEDDIDTKIEHMLASSPIEDAEEWAVHSHMNFCGLNLEFCGIEAISKLAQFIIEHGALGVAVHRYFGEQSDIDATIQFLEDNYAGAYESEAEFAESIFYETDVTPDFPQHILSYINFEHYAYDLFINDYLSFGIDGETHVFYRFT